MARSQGFTLSLVIPAYNEAENIPLLLGRLAEDMASFDDVEIVVVDDGSSDDTRDALRRSLNAHPELRFVSLSRNFGHQIALRAGMEQTTGDCVICMDADLQHPPELIGDMVRQWQAGADIVNCIREDQKSLSLFKRLTSRWFYKLLSSISGLQLMPGSSDFRLLDRNVVDILNRLPEADLFYRGIIPTLGFRVVAIDYQPGARIHGKSKYTLRKMTKLALNGVVSTSVRPLRLATYFAFLTALAGAVFLAYVLYVYFVSRTGVPGWASTLGVTLIIGTMQLLVLGMIGEYLGQVLKETRHRPPYYIAETGGAPPPHGSAGRPMMQNEIFRAGLLAFYTIISVAGMTMIKDAQPLFSLKGLLGLGLYVGGFLIWIGVILRIMPMSQAFPLAAGCLMLGTQFAGWFILRERITLLHIAGMILILAGVIVVGLVYQPKT